MSAVTCGVSCHLRCQRFCCPEVSPEVSPCLQALVPAAPRVSCHLRCQRVCLSAGPGAGGPACQLSPEVSPEVSPDVLPCLQALVPAAPRAQSTWRGLWSKSLMVWPFMWPKKSFFLQMCVVICILLLIIGRVVNLYTPILYKMISETLNCYMSLHISAVYPRLLTLAWQSSGRRLASKISSILC